jgi:preprotein translocase subunit SecG
MISGILTFAYILTCLFLIFVVLIQKGEGGGLGGFVGGGAVDVAFGAKADTTWKRATAIAAGLFIVLTLILGIVKRPASLATAASKEQQEEKRKEDEKKKADEDKKKAEAPGKDDKTPGLAPTGDKVPAGTTPGEKK